MICKPDNVKTFENEQVYTVKCEACNLFCKIQHYRQCQERFEWNKEHGKDILAPIKEANRIAQSQTGKPIEPVDGVQPLGVSQPNLKTNTKNKGKPRHRRGK